ncbi:hypothetical protein ABTZ58_06860 [Streptomyces sp. NPDC094143]|uniref:hypothetical protein n=1 Tax=Streptomyces sp. NPDC094143 TaxID=3155310 RepID=UPI00331E56FE
MLYTPHTHVQYRPAQVGELNPGCTVDMRSRPQNRVDVLFSPPEISQDLTEQLTLISSHQVASGSWRQDGPGLPDGHWLSVTRWERVLGAGLPSGWLVAAVEEAGSCIFLVAEDTCTHRLQNDVNDMLYALACKGVYLQCWFRCPPTPPGGLLDPRLRPPAPLAVP